MHDLKHTEEQKRERHWNPRERWRVLQETIAWADSQQQPPRNSRETCLRLQAGYVPVPRPAGGAEC